VMHCAHDPGEVLLGLNRILSPQLHAQLVSAAYLWLDTENRVGILGCRTSAIVALARREA
jgi:hypothetical protein